VCRDAAESRITTLVNTGGDALERYVYTPYGELTIYDATWWNVRSVSSDAHTYTYNGRQLHAETGLYDYRHRTYHSPLGSFVGIRSMRKVWIKVVITLRVMTSSRGARGLQFPGG
jgi:RHS repeat-associated protein